MALLMQQKNESIRVICSHDGSLVDDLSDEDFAEYLQTLDESKLRFKEGQKPTYFVLSKVLSFEAEQRIMNQQMRTETKPGQKRQESVATPAFIMEDVRCSLTAIEHPETLTEAELANTIKWKPAKDGFTDKDLIAFLHANGIVMELYIARAAATGKRKNDESSIKKK